jgi:NAD(P)-dependent dehydrogenase (short-subunit alcohol dehydrogenase family)
MTERQLPGSTALVTGASRGFGRAVAAALAKEGASVIGVARDAAALAGVREQLGSGFTPVAADAADPVTAGALLSQYRPQTLVLAAGTAPLSRPIQEHTWESFSRPWEVDVRQVFGWTREALLLPLAPGSTVIAFSSGAALFGSALSGGYAGAKATIRFMAGYAADEAERAGLDLRFCAVLPQLTPATVLGAKAVEAYAERSGLSVEDFLAARGPLLTTDQVGQAVADLAAGRDEGARAYVLSAAGLKPLT